MKVEEGKWYKCIKTICQYSYGQMIPFVEGIKYRLTHSFNYGVEHILVDEKGIRSPFNIMDNNFEGFFEEIPDC